MTNNEFRRNDEARTTNRRSAIAANNSDFSHSDFLRQSDFGFRHSFMVFLQAPHLNFSFLQ